MSIPDQQRTARKYAEDRGWQVVAEFKDKHRSAFRKVERKEFEALLEAASDGKIDVIIARHQDRLLRHPETYSRLLEICVRRNIEIHLYGSGGFLDLSTSQGGFMGMMNTAIAWQESAIRSERVRAAVERNTRAGKRPAADRDRSDTKSSGTTRERALGGAGASSAKSWSQPRLS